MAVIIVGLARSVYIHRIWPYIWWFPCQKYRIHTVYIWFWPTLNNRHDAVWNTWPDSHSSVLCTHIGKGHSHLFKLKKGVGARAANWPCIDHFLLCSLPLSQRRLLQTHQCDWQCSWSILVESVFAEYAWRYQLLLCPSPLIQGRLLQTYQFDWQCSWSILVESVFAEYVEGIISFFVCYRWARGVF